MNVLELVLGQLIQEKNLLESELERVVNDSNLTITEMVSKSKNLFILCNERSTKTGKWRLYFEIGCACCIP